MAEVGSGTGFEIVAWARCPDGTPMEDFALALQEAGNRLGEWDHRGRRIELAMDVVVKPTKGK